MKWRSLQESDSCRDVRSLREIFSERKELIARYVPADVQAVHARAVAELKARGLAANALINFGVGAKAPSFELPDHNGKGVSSAELLAKGRVVISFIRGRWCPFCVGQMEAMSFIGAEIEAAGGSLVAVSPQTEKQAFFIARPAQASLPAAGGRSQPTGSAVRAGLPRLGRTAGALLSHLCESAVREWRPQLGIADSRNVCD